MSPVYPKIHPEAPWYYTLYPWKSGPLPLSAYLFHPESHYAHQWNLYHLLPARKAHGFSAGYLQFHSAPRLQCEAGTVHPLYWILHGPVRQSGLSSYGK